MHSQHFDSFYVHYNGGFDDDFIFVSAENGEPVIKNKTGDTIELRIELPEIRKFVMEHARPFSPDLKIKLTGRSNAEENAPTCSFEVDGKELFDFYIDVIGRQLIYAIEELDADDFYTKIMKSADVTAEDIINAK